MIRQKKWAVIAFFFLQAFNVIAISILTLKDPAISIITAFAACLLFSLLLLIPKNGKCGWEVIFFQENKKPEEKEISIGKAESDSMVEEVNQNTKEFIAQSSEIGENLEMEPVAVIPEKKVKVKKFTQWIISYKEAILTILLIAVASGISFCIWNSMHNSPESQMERADNLFRNGQLTEAIKIYTNLADNEGYVKAKVRLGCLYLANDSVEHNFEKGTHYLKQVVPTDSNSFINIVNAYKSCYHETNSIDVENDCSDEIRRYLEIATRKGWCLGFVNRTMGWIYYCDRRVEFSTAYYSTAYYYFESGYELGDARSASFLGVMCYYGNGCDVDFNKARKHFESALKLDKKESLALWGLGMLYRYGKGVPEDLAKAKKYFKEAADLGDSNAKKEYGELMMNGRP